MAFMSVQGAEGEVYNIKTSHINTVYLAPGDKPTLRITFIGGKEKSFNGKQAQEIWDALNANPRFIQGPVKSTNGKLLANLDNISTWRYLPAGAKRKVPAIIVETLAGEDLTVEAAAADALLRRLIKEGERRA